jgi:transposase-like protein
VRDQLARHGLLDVGQTPKTLPADYSELGSIHLVAERHGVSFSTARRWLLASGVELSDAHRPARTDIDIASAGRRYEAGDSLADVAQDLGIGVNTLKRRLEANGVAMRRRGPRPISG